MTASTRIPSMRHGFKVVNIVGSLVIIVDQLPQMVATVMRNGGRRMELRLFEWRSSWIRSINS